jgi:type III secretion system FlhB-like substrate exporter
MNDLEIAKKILKENDLTLVFVKDGKIIFEGKFKGMRELILVVDKFESQLKNSSVADSVVGKAAASLFILSKVNSVFAGKISEAAIDFLKEKNIPFEYDEMVEKILNKDGTDTCPFEKIALPSKSPEETYREIKSFLKL